MSLFSYYSIEKSVVSLSCIFLSWFSMFILCLSISCILIQILVRCFQFSFVCSFRCCHSSAFNSPPWYTGRSTCSVASLWVLIVVDVSLIFVATIGLVLTTLIIRPNILEVSSIFIVISFSSGPPLVKRPTSSANRRLLTSQPFNLIQAWVNT